MVSLDLLAGVNRVFLAMKSAEKTPLKSAEFISFCNRSVRRTRDFRIQRNKFLSTNCSHRRLHCSNWLLKWHAFAVREDESPPETSDDTQLKLWHDNGMNSLTGTGICRHQGATEI